MTDPKAIEGTWEFIADTPMGQQNCTLSVVPADDAFTGVVKGDFGELEVQDGTIADGDAGTTLTWIMKLKNPLPLTVKCDATLDGEELHGNIAAAGIGSFVIAGKRV